MTPNRLFVVGAVLLVTVGLVLAFVFLGSPSHQRRVALDGRRVGDLARIANLLHGRYRRGELPPSLSENAVARDPITQRSYEYRRVDATHYVLCAVFDTDSIDDWPPGNWRHGAGRTCYELDVRDSPPAPRRVQ